MRRSHSRSSLTIVLTAIPLTLVLALAGGASAASAASSAAATTGSPVTTSRTASSTGMLIAIHSGKCLEVASEATDGDGAYQMSCKSAATGQQWQIDPSAAAGAVTLKSVSSGRCLRAAESDPVSNDAAVALASCNAADPAEQWKIVGVSADGLFRSVSVSSSMCLAVKGSSTADGALLYQAPCVADVSQTNQQWRVG